MIATLVGLLGSYHASSDFSNVITISRSILAVIPDDQVSLQFLGLAYYRTGRVAEAIETFDKVVSKRQSARRTEQQCGVTYLTHDDYAVAACYQEATRHNPEIARAWYDLGTVLQKLGKIEQSIPAFRSALLAEPEFPQAMLAMGQSALRVDDLAVAEDAFCSLRTLQPDNGEAYHGLGLVFRKRRDFAAARACFKRVRKARDSRQPL